MLMGATPSRPASELERGAGASSEADTSMERKTQTECECGEEVEGVQTCV